MARTALSAILFATTLLAAPAFAQQARRDVRLTIEDCGTSAIDVPEAYRAAALELGLRDEDRARPAEPRGVSLLATLDCEQGVRARLTLDSAKSSARRTIKLDDTPSRDRPRVLALALAELVRAEWRWVTTGTGEDGAAPPDDERWTRDERAEPGVAAESAKDGDKPKPNRALVAAPPPADAHADAATAPRRATAAERRGEPGLTLEVLGRGRAPLAEHGFTYGAALGTRYRRWSGTVEALFGGTRTELGQASFGLFNARVAFELLRFEQGRWHLALEPGVAAGATWLTGTTDNPDVEVTGVTAPYADARLGVRAELRFAAVSPVLLFELGRAAGLAATEDGETIGITGGWFAGVALGAAFGGSGF